MTFKSVAPAIIELMQPLVDADLSGKKKAYVQKAPQNETGPFIIVQKVDSNIFGKNVLDRAAGVAGTVQAYIQIDAYSLSYYDTDALAKMIESTLDGYGGTVYYGGNSPQDFVVIGGITLQNDVDILDETEEPTLHRNSAVYLVTYNQ